jgi:hypothetical protein
MEKIMDAFLQRCCWMRLAQLWEITTTCVSLSACDIIYRLSQNLKSYTIWGHSRCLLFNFIWPVIKTWPTGEFPLIFPHTSHKVDIITARSRLLQLQYPINILPMLRTEWSDTFAQVWTFMTWTENSTFAFTPPIRKWVSLPNCLDAVAERKAPDPVKKGSLYRPMFQGGVEV